MSLYAKSPILSVGSRGHSKVKSVDMKQSKGIPHEINYQGWIGDATDTTGITDVPGMIFRLYTASTGGTPVWSETHVAVSVDKGIFNVLLGSVTPLPTDKFTGDHLWLETQVTTDTLSPRKKLVSVGYAIKSEEADHAIHSDTADYALAANVNIDSVAYADTAGYVDGANVDGEVAQANNADTAGYASSSAPDNDWTVSGSKLYAQDTSWNVGIGTASPFTDARLYVEANGKSYGVYGRGNTGKTAGVYGWANGAHYGVYGLGSTGKTAGMFGWANNADYGVYGLGSTGKVAGVYGKANGADYGVYGAGSIGKVAGVYGKAGGASYAGYFDGDVHIEGEVTMKKVVRYYSIPGCKFGAKEETYDWYRAHYLRTNTSGSTYWYASVHLPDGAVVKEVSAYVLDNDVVSDIGVNLHGRDHSGLAAVMAWVTSSGASSDVRTITDNIISNAKINNADYCYYAKVVLASGDNTHGLHQIRIKYEITHPLP